MVLAFREGYRSLDPIPGSSTDPNPMPDVSPATDLMAGPLWRPRPTWPHSWRRNSINSMRSGVFEPRDGSPMATEVANSRFPNEKIEESGVRNREFFR